MELVTVRLPGFGSGAFCAGGSCAAAGRASRKEHAAVSASRHTNFDTNDFEFIDPPLDMRVERGRASALVPTAEQDGRHCLRRPADHRTMICLAKRGESRRWRTRSKQKCVAL